MLTLAPDVGSSRSTLPRDGVGLGLRVQHYPWILEHGVPVDFLEIITENFLGDAEAPRRKLKQIRGNAPVVLHGVGLNLFGPEPPNDTYLDSVKRLADEVDAPFVTDHLCWTGVPGRSHHDLLPVPFVPELVDLAAERAAYVQKRLDRPFGLENLSSYVTFRRSSMTEWDFLASVVEQADCGYLLDVNNIVVSGVNFGFDPLDYLAAIDFSRVLQVHIAGHSVDPRGGLIDTHDHLPVDAMWSLYAEAWRRGGPFPTLLEWDDQIPSVPELLSVLDRATVVRS